MSTHRTVSAAAATSAVAATLVLLSGCGEEPRRPDPAPARAAHQSAATAMDASFDRELGGGAAQPAARPAAPKPTPKPAADAPATPAVAAGPTIEQGRPSWIDQPPTEAGKLYAVGGAPRGQRDAAQANARKELAAQLRVHVAGRTASEESEVTKTGPGGERVSRAYASFRTEVQTTVDRSLDGTSILAVADDGKQLWALAMLDRVAWAARLQQEIAAVDAKLVAEHDRVAAASAGLRQAAKALRTAGPLVARREALVDDLRLADPAITAPACPVDIQALLNACAQQLAMVAIKLEGADDAVFAARLQSAMAALGLTVTERSGQAITIRLALRETPRNLPNGWTKINVAGSATVLDPATGTVAGSLQIDESAADVDASQAKSKMLDNAAKALAKAIDEQLIDLLAAGVAARP